MITAVEISRTIVLHLNNLGEAQELLEGAVAAWRFHGDGSRLVPAIDALLGALEDIRMHAGALTDVKHRFILHYLSLEAEVLLETSLGGNAGTLAEAGLRRDAQGVWHVEADRVERLGPDALADVCARFVHVRLNPFLRGWRAPAKSQVFQVA